MFVLELGASHNGLEFDLFNTKETWVYDSCLCL